MSHYNAPPANALKATMSFNIRFSEIDAMRVVWHGVYVKFLEDVREYFGRQFGLGYNLIESNGFYAPIVDLSIQYKQPLFYGMTPEITAIYRPTLSAKIVFDYEIRNTTNESLVATAHSVQVFMDRDYQLVWESPQFYKEWKSKWGIDQ